MTDPHHSGAYPSPTIVVGIGRFGLAVLELLGRDWDLLASAGDDPTLQNLRLLHVDGIGGESEWRARESHMMHVATHVGDGDMPSLALNFAVLRTLGLIRRHFGTYELAVPRDAGLTEIDSGAGGDDGEAGRPARLRFFDWVALGPDPVVAVDRLRVLAEQDDDVDVFVTPMINRVRQGHSPRTMLCLLSRCRALAEGRDPVPWAWLARAVDGAVSDDGTVGNTSTHVACALGASSAWPEDHLLGGYVPGPAPDTLHVPRVAVPAVGDLASPLFPWSGNGRQTPQVMPLLTVDWQRNGWASAPLDGEADTVTFRPVMASPACLGLFDHDPGPADHERAEGMLSERLKLLATYVHRGLVRLWVDLRRHRVETYSEELARSHAASEFDAAQRQSLELLGELVVRPIVASNAPDNPRANRAPRDDVWVDGEPLPPSASERLSALVQREYHALSGAPGLIERRFDALGLGQGGASPKTSLLSTVRVEARAAPESYLEIAGTDAKGGAPGARRGGDTTDDDGFDARDSLREFGQRLDAITRQLFDMAYLQAYRTEPTRRPARLTIYVVSDMGEPVARGLTRAVIKIAHAQLRRAYSPIFETYRTGFDRSLAVTPIIWTPHPADAFGRGQTPERREEEAVIIEAIQALRRFIETTPKAERCVAQMFVNSRVTDNAVVSVRDAVRQTRDFLSLYIRHEAGLDPWLRHATTGPHGEDFLGSFACYEIAFPATRVREYLANRFARQALAHVRDGEPDGQPPVAPDLDLPTESDLLRPAREALTDHVERVRAALADRARNAAPLRPDVPGAVLRDAWGEPFGERISGELRDAWMRLARDRGAFDDHVDDVRRRVRRRLPESLARNQRHADELIRQFARAGRVEQALAGFHRMQRCSHDDLVDAERARVDAVGSCAANGVPDVRPIDAARKAVVDAATEKPDLTPMRVGTVAVVPAALAAGAVLVSSILKGIGWHQEPNAVEPIVAALAPFLGGALIIALFIWLQRRYMAKALERIRDAIERMAETVGSVVTASSRPSVRSFFDARLRLTAALALRQLSGAVHVCAAADVRRAQRIRRSLDVQARSLQLRAESLGVQVRNVVGSDDTDDLTYLFASRLGGVEPVMTSAEAVRDYYARTVGDASAIEQAMPRFLLEIDAFEQWRDVAPLSDTEAILRFSRTLFRSIVDQPAGRQSAFEDEMRERILAFVRRLYPNIGFGAKFRGYEGLDPDGVHVVADATVVSHPDVLSLVRPGSGDVQGERLIESIALQPSEQLHNALYLLSLVQGIRPHSIWNLRRFESYHDRPLRPDNTDWRAPNGRVPPRLTALSGHIGLIDELNNAVLGQAERIATPDEPMNKPVARAARRMARTLSGDVQVVDATTGDGSCE